MARWPKATRVRPAKAGIQPRGLDAASQVEGPAEATWRSKSSEPRGVLDARVRDYRMHTIIQLWHGSCDRIWSRAANRSAARVIFREGAGPKCLLWRT